METTKLKKFAQSARRTLLTQVGSKLKLVLAKDSAARRENPLAVAELEQQLAASSDKQVVEQVAYLWFNRLCALRFMDANAYNRIRVVSPADGQFQPEILAEAKAGHIDEGLLQGKLREQVLALLSGAAPSRDPQGEAYRLLVVAVCNDYHRLMPYLFARIDDYSELLMPDDLLSENSILAATREAMTPEACESVEVIGWLYQFYISEKKDEVFEGLKNNKKITAENIPAATQLFTPHWIVRYLVENSLGRLWLLNHPQSGIRAQMAYYIEPETPERDFLKIRSPEELKICDPACGSGHMLTYAYDLLFAIYVDAGYDAAEIPEKILTHNLYGIEIDERAAELAAFALAMKALKGDPLGAGNNRRRFFRKPLKPNICRLEKVVVSAQAVDDYVGFVGRDLFTADLRQTLKQFEEADNVGSLIRPALRNAADALATLEAKDVAGQLFLTGTHASVLKVLRQAAYLSPQYHVVIANPPYMGSKGMNGRLAEWIKDHYPDSKSDLFAAFIERNLDLAQKQGAVAMITMQSWMFLSSFEKLRTKLLDTKTITSMAHLGARAFDSIGGEVVSTTAFVLENAHRPDYKGNYLRLVDGNSETEKQTAILATTKNLNCGYLFRASAADFEKIPGSPIAYWFSKFYLFKNESIGSILISGGRCKTHDDEKYVRYHWEIDCSKNHRIWRMFEKGGDFRKWYGNRLHIVNWTDNAKKEYSSHGGLTRPEFWGRPAITWSDITSTENAFRLKSRESEYSSVSPSFFSKNDDEKLLFSILGFLNTKLTSHLLKVINPTLHANPGDVAKIPACKVEDINSVHTAIKVAKEDWDSFETSWDFAGLPLLTADYEAETLAETYANLRQHWQAITLEMQRLEVENNRIFIEAYGLQDELTPDVPLNEITLTCNPHYRYANSKTDAELETQLQADTMAEFLSYAVGCMFGRYSIDQSGLILANQGDTLQHYLAKVPQPRFTPDADNVIPLIDFDGDWFEDDIGERFKHFLKITLGAENYPANLKFIEDALGKDVRKYFLKDFYADHVKRYKKRPIYWLFSSPKGTFNALIYLHRYQPDTASIVLNDYLREFRTKLTARKQALEQVGIRSDTKENQGEKTKALKAIAKIDQALAEINDYERDTLYPLATRQIALDLDDGVKVNYPKLGKALKSVAGLS